MKKCMKCGGEKLRAEFYGCPSNRDGLRGVCKCCINKYEKTRREKLRANPQQSPENKKCPKCGVIKRGGQFYKDPKRLDGLWGSCKSCARDKQRLRRYGLTPGEYKEILLHQQGRCAICGSTSSKKVLYVDHDHKTDQVRGLLCVKCNAGIGLFEDNPETLRKAIEYLMENHQNAKAITTLPSSLPSVGPLETDCAP